MLSRHTITYSSEVHLYTRRNLAHAWKYERTCDREIAEVARDVNASYDVDTLLVPVAFEPRSFLDSYQTQEDFAPLYSEAQGGAL